MHLRGCILVLLDPLLVKWYGGQESEYGLIFAQNTDSEQGLRSGRQYERSLPGRALAYNLVVFRSTSRIQATIYDIPEDVWPPLSAMQAARIEDAFPRMTRVARISRPSCQRRNGRPPTLEKSA
jgi:hypothetical protein